uniref:Uncharacterized protein n=1 Tax=Oryza punctata TaxID=4537 RepID=A0A0E0LIJ9_ORYPU
MVIQLSRKSGAVHILCYSFSVFYNVEAQVWVCVLGTSCHTAEEDVPRRGLTPLGQPPTPPSDDLVHVQDNYFVADWRLTPPSWPPTPPSGDFVPVQNGHFVAD